MFYQKCFIFQPENSCWLCSGVEKEWKVKEGICSAIFLFFALFFIFSLEERHCRRVWESWVVCVWQESQKRVVLFFLHFFTPTIPYSILVGEVVQVSQGNMRIACTYP